MIPAFRKLVAAKRTGRSAAWRRPPRDPSSMPNGTTDRFGEACHVDRSAFLAGGAHTGPSSQCCGVHWKQGGVSPGSQCERSQTPSGPVGSWHCTPDSLQVAVGPAVNEPQSQATATRTDPSRAATRSIDRGESASLGTRTWRRGSRGEWTRFTDPLAPPNGPGALLRLRSRRGMVVAIEIPPGSVSVRADASPPPSNTVEMRMSTSIRFGPGGYTARPPRFL